MREINIYMLINSITCNELTIGCRVWQSKSLKTCMPHISYWWICQETRNEVGVNAPRLSILGLFSFCKVTYTPRRREQGLMYSLRMHLTIDKILYNLKIISFEDPFMFRFQKEKDPFTYGFTVYFEQLACPILLLFGYSNLARGQTNS